MEMESSSSTSGSSQESPSSPAAFGESGGRHCRRHGKQSTTSGSTFKSSWSLFTRLRQHCLKRDKRKHFNRNKSKTGGRKLNIFEHQQLVQTNSNNPTETTLKWDKLSPNEFETLQEYIQCKFRSISIKQIDFIDPIFSSCKRMPLRYV